MSTEPRRAPDIPHNPELERALVGIALIKPDAVYHLTTPPEHFWSPAWRNIWTAAIKAMANHETPEPHQIAQHLTDHTGYDHTASVNDAIIHAVAPTQATQIAQTLHELHNRRQTINLANQLAARARSGEPTHDLLDALQAPQTPADDLGPTPINWPEFWQHDGDQRRFIVHNIIPADGRLISIVAAHKTGKSESILAAAVAAATGQPPFGQPGLGQPIDVIYLDYEMTVDDLQDRLATLGYGPDTDLTHFHYYLIPQLPPLNTPQGAQALLELVDRHQAQLLIIDTFSRVIEGKENDSEPYRDFYRLTGAQLKARGVTTVRLDHTGKDTTLGARGSSAKGDDVDIQWTVTRTDDGTRFAHKGKTRIGWVPEKVDLQRHVNGDEISYTYAPGNYGWAEGTKAAAEALDRIGAPIDIGANQACRNLKDAGLEHRRKAVLDAVKWRQQQANREPFSLGTTSGTTPQPDPGTTTGNHPEPPTKPQVPDRNQSGNHPEPPPPQVVPGFPLYKREPVPSRGELEDF